MHASFAVRKQKAVRFYGAFMTNATQMQRCGCVCGSQALVCVLPSETSRGGCGHFFGRKKTPTELSDTEFSAREGYESSPTVLRAGRLFCSTIFRRAASLCAIRPRATRFASLITSLLLREDAQLASVLAEA